MLRSCIVCAEATSTPANFLLTCSSCAASYHHRCHTPVLIDAHLIALVKASTAAAKGATQDLKTPTLHNWKCTPCTLHPRTPPPPVLLDLTIDDPDEVNPQQPAHTQQIKAEQLPYSLPPRKKYNTAPAWIHKQHADSQTADAWDRLAAKNRSPRPRKVAAKSLAKQSFIHVASVWLESRRSTLPVL